MDYKPPITSLPILGAITNSLKTSIKIDSKFQNDVRAIFKLPGGQLYYDSVLDLDSDGSRWAKEDPTGQSDTSLHNPNGSPVDADKVPYIVLPSKGFYQQFKIQLSDVAAVIFNNNIEFAVFADRGPSKKLGEGSIQLHRSLGHETIRNGRFHNEAIDGDVITIVFPASGDKTPQTPDKVRDIGKKLFKELGGNPP